MYMRAMGASVGRGVCCLGHMGTEFDQVSVGDGSVMNPGSALLTHTVENRCVKIHPVSIGRRVTVGVSCVILPNATMDDGSSLADMSLVSVSAAAEAATCLGV